VGIGMCYFFPRQLKWAWSDEGFSSGDGVFWAAAYMPCTVFGVFIIFYNVEVILNVDFLFTH